MTDLVSWQQRAQFFAARRPASRVGATVGKIQSVPFRSSEGAVFAGHIDVLDVPREGNCLYHSVWQAAKSQGVLRPFGLSGVAHVFELRVVVAERTKQLLESRAIDAFSEADHSAICDTIAQPDQYLFESGWLSLMAMSHILRRTIVVLAVEGVVTVVPHDFSSFLGEEERELPIVIYHCSAMNICKMSPPQQRNHYVAGVLNRNKLLATRRLIRRHRSIGRSQTPLAATAETEPRHHVIGCSQVHTVISDATDPQGLHAMSNPDANEDSSNNAEPTTTTKRPRVNDDAELLRSLSARALSVVRLSSNEEKALFTTQQFSSCPKLALLYFHCCSGHPDAYVHNNESLLNDETAPRVKARLLNTLELPPTVDEVYRCQVAANGSSNDIVACASCCEIIHTQDYVVFDNLPAVFELTPEEKMSIRETPKWVLKNHTQILEANGTYYHLNPDLVKDTSEVIICKKCSKDPRAVPFSIASGHDYGRKGDLPDLNDVAASCISPVRCFGLELSLNGKHASGHAICFPSNGPQGCAKVLPKTETDAVPRVTFIGSKDKWRLKKKQYKKLYELPAEIVYQWLRVLQHTHSGFRNEDITVDESPARQQELVAMEALIEASIIFDDSDSITNASEAIFSERFGGDVEVGDDDNVMLTRSAVLKQPSEQNSVWNGSSSVIDKMIEILGVSGGHREGNERIVAVQRENEPIIEWDQNGFMIACAFPQLFLLGGNSLPDGTWGPGFIRHLMNYYDGRFERNTMLIALLFNQLQRHTAVKKAASVGLSHPGLLERFGSIVNSVEFKNRLIRAKENPESRASKQLNTSLLRVLSVVGGCVPFSPFERAASRPKISGLRARFGVPQHFVTTASPEHDDLYLHRVAQIRSQSVWNSLDNVFVQRGCTYNDLPAELIDSARMRLSVSNLYPALAVRVFENCLDIMFNCVLLCKRSSSVRASRPYFMRETGAYGKVAAHCTVVEAQVDGRLHSHSMIYGSAYTPQLLSRIVCSPELRSRAVQWLESVSCTKVNSLIHEWRSQLQDTSSKFPRAFEIDLPLANESLNQFYFAAEKRMAATNFHTHSSTCLKGKRGKYMCRLSRPAGVHSRQTEPLLIIRHAVGDLAKGIRPQLEGCPIDDNICKHLDSGYDASTQSLFTPHLSGPIIWELHRPETDKMFVESNRVLAALTKSHTNSALINGEDSGDMVEQYQQQYMTKDQGGLKSAIPAVISAIDHIAAHPSRADDANTCIRTGKYLAARTINAFSGAHEWSHTVMVHALLGNRSFISSESFWYIFPHPLVKWMQNAVDARSGTGSFDSEPVEAGHEYEEDRLHEELDELTAMADNGNFAPRNRGGEHAGTRSFSIDKRVVFVSQLECYLHRGPHFLEYSPLEYVSIVDVLPVKSETENSGRGRCSRVGFPFAKTHPLYNHYNGYIRMKMHTPIFGGRQPPPWNDGVLHDASMKSKRAYLAKYILSVFTSWGINDLIDPFDEARLFDVFRCWDNSEAPLVNRQRVRYMRNMLKRGHRSSINEYIAGDWRCRNSDIWRNQPFVPEPHQSKTKRATDDCERDGIICNASEIDQLVEVLMNGNSKKRNGLLSIQAALTEVIGEPLPVFANRRIPKDFSIFNCSQSVKLAEIASRIQQMAREDDKDDRNERNTGPFDHLGGFDMASVNLADLSSEQASVVTRVLCTIGKEQSLTMLHGAGGTGKSFVVRKICDAIEQRGLKVISTCPTGAGACQLKNGQTFHSALRVGRKNGTSQRSIDLLKLTFDRDVVLVVVDEVSMLSAEFLAILDEKLRALYRSSVRFGGLSILLVGDFSQLQVVSRVPLCKNMYIGTDNPRLLVSKALFQEFKVVFLQSQQRAKGCNVHKQRLEEMRMLPQRYPDGVDWSPRDLSDFQPLSIALRRSLLNPLTPTDVDKDSLWIESSVILVTSNADRAVMNAKMAEVLSSRQKNLLFRWRRTILDTHMGDLGNAVELLYNESERPTLFAYFFKNATGQILDNACGNVARGIANGTMCRYHSLAWVDSAKTKTVMKLVEECANEYRPIIDLPFPPDYINVIVLDRTGKPMSASSWPPNCNVATFDASDPTANDFVIPIGLMTSNSEQNWIRVHQPGKKTKLKVSFNQHAVDLAMAMTVWKAQGATFDRVLLLMDVSPGSPSWQFEHIYVALSRVRAADHIRCIPVAFNYKRNKLHRLRPNIFTVKWRLDLDNEGYWHKR